MTSRFDTATISSFTLDAGGTRSIGLDVSGDSTGTATGPHHRLSHP